VDSTQTFAHERYPAIGQIWFSFPVSSFGREGFSSGGDVLLDPPKCGLIQVRHSAKELNA